MHTAWVLTKQESKSGHLSIIRCTLVESIFQNFLFTVIMLDNHGLWDNERNLEKRHQMCIESEALFK